MVDECSPFIILHNIDMNVVIASDIYLFKVAAVA